MLSFEDIYTIYDKHKDSFNTKVKEFKIGSKHFNFNSEPYILGIVNLSTDSWYKESICYNSEQAISRSKVLTIQGADIIDIGTESTLLKTERVGALKQNSKVLPVLQTLSQEGILTSIETYYPEVARECLQAGANIINFTGTENKEEVYQTVAEFDAGVIICYLQGKNARELESLTIGDDPIDLVYDYFAREVEIATKLGVTKIFIDPGLGFSYRNLSNEYPPFSLRVRFKMQTLINTFRLRRLGFPVCIHLPTVPEFFTEQFRSSQPFMAVLATLGKTDLMRTHEVPKIRAVLETLSLF